MIFKADIIIWDFDKLEQVHRLKLHKVLIQSLAFSHNEQYLASLGGQDDNTLVIWEVIIIVLKFHFNIDRKRQSNLWQSCWNEYCEQDWVL